jgi:hypothetical protein
LANNGCSGNSGHYTLTGFFADGHRHYIVSGEIAEIAKAITDTGKDESGDWFLCYLSGDSGSGCWKYFSLLNRVSV